MRCKQCWKLIQINKSELCSSCLDNNKPKPKYEHHIKREETAKNNLATFISLYTTIFNSFNS